MALISIVPMPAASASADDIDLSQAALHPADEGDGEGIDAAGDAGNVHQVAGEDEEGNRQKRKALHPRDQPLGGNDVRGDVIKDDIENRGDGHGDCHRQAEDHQKEKGADQKQHGINPRRSGILRAARAPNNPAAYWR
jgi:hypothetical protein